MPSSTMLPVMTLVKTPPSRTKPTASVIPVTTVRSTTSASRLRSWVLHADRRRAAARDDACCTAATSLPLLLHDAPRPSARRSPRGARPSPGAIGPPRRRQASTAPPRDALRRSRLVDALHDAELMQRALHEGLVDPGIDADGRRARRERPRTEQERCRPSDHGPVQAPVHAPLLLEPLLVGEVREGRVDEV